MSKQKPTFQEMMKKRQQGDFVGRANQLALFDDNLKLALEDEKRRFIFNVWGQGGAGKTTLVAQFQRLARERDAAVAYINEAERDVPTIMERMAEQLKGKNNEFKQFEERHKVWRQKREELETDPEVPQGMADLIGRTLMKGVIRAGRRVPVGGVALDFIDEDAAADQAGEWAEFVRRRLTNKDEVRLVLEPVEMLTPLFVDGLRKIGDTPRQLALFFDTYEQTGIFVDAWLRDVLNGRYGDLPGDLVIVIAGRDELDRNNWADYQSFLVRLPLDAFSEEEAHDFLARKGITHPEVVRIILELSGRLPLLVATLAAESPNEPDQVGDVTGTAVDRFLKWIEDPCQRQLALDAALPQSLNQDLIQQLITEACGNSVDLFRWLKTMPFVKETAVGWQYHEVVRTQMLRYQRRESPDRWQQLHGHLAAYYEQQQKESDPIQNKRQTTHRGREALFSTLYHRLCQSPERNLALVLNGYFEPFAQQLVKGFDGGYIRLLREASRDSENQELGTWASHLEELAEGISEEAKAGRMLGICSELLNVPSLSARAKSVILSIRTVFYGYKEKFDTAMADINEAIELDKDNILSFGLRAAINEELKNYKVTLADLNRAIELEGKAAWAIASRGETYRQMGQYEAALADFDRAIELDGKYAWAIASRGQTYRQMGQYEAALADFDRAIELDGKLAWAIAERGEMYRQMGQYEAALADFDRAIELDAKEDWSFYGRAFVYRIMGQTDEAAHDFTRAIQLAQVTYNEKTCRQWQNCFNLALYQLVGGDHETGRCLYEEALGAGAPVSAVRDGIEDLDDYLKQFGEDRQIQAIRNLLASYLANSAAGDQ
jgi:tetratricopeptide (TPR) repeat protein